MRESQCKAGFVSHAHQNITQSNPRPALSLAIVHVMAIMATTQPLLGDC